MFEKDAISCNAAVLIVVGRHLNIVMMLLWGGICIAVELHSKRLLIWRDDGIEEENWFQSAQELLEVVGYTFDSKREGQHYINIQHEENH